MPKITVDGQELRTVTALTGPMAPNIAAELAHQCVWFACEPRPDDGWAFTVKEDQKRALASVVAQYGPVVWEV